MSYQDRCVTMVQVPKLDTAKQPTLKKSKSVKSATKSVVNTFTTKADTLPRLDTLPVTARVDTLPVTARVDTLPVTARVDTYPTIYTQSTDYQTPPSYQSSQSTYGNSNWSSQSASQSASQSGYQRTSVGPIGLPIKSTTLLPNLPMVEVDDFEIKDYDSITSTTNIETELVKNGYTPVSKIAIVSPKMTKSGRKSPKSAKKTNDTTLQYVKSINKKGQTVFVLVDVDGYTTERITDVSLIEVKDTSKLSQSIKSGAYNCASNDVCGVVFECGCDTICVVSRDAEEFTPRESTFSFVDSDLSDEGETVTPYPLVRLSEIKTDPSAVLCNTDTVMKRLRNSSYTFLLQEFNETKSASSKLSESVGRFDRMLSDAATKLSKTLSQLEQWNNFYIKSPPTSQEEKERLSKIQYNLLRRNEGITTLLLSMKKVVEKQKEINLIAAEIADISEFCEKQFANVEYVLTE